MKIVKIKENSRDQYAILTPEDTLTVVEELMEGEAMRVVPDSNPTKRYLIFTKDVYESRR